MLPKRRLGGDYESADRPAKTLKATFWVALSRRSSGLGKAGYRHVEARRAGAAMPIPLIRVGMYNTYMLLPFHR